MKVRIGSRESKLAVIQAEIVMDAIRKFDSSIELELVTMKTTGDKILDRNLDKVGGKGLFIKELERALLDEEIDLAVHSMKDVPMDLHEDLPILCVSAREDPRDALILPEGSTEIDFSKPIGCSSNRRMLQFAKLYPQAKFAPIRGNIQTRLRKLDSGEYGATIMAVSGLKRAGLSGRISRIFSPDEMLPAACQGVLAIQGRRGFDVSFLKDFSDTSAWQTAISERSFVRELDGGCTSPIAAYATICGSQLKLAGLNVDESGKPFTAELMGNVAYGEQLGRALAERMKR